LPQYPAACEVKRRMDNKARQYYKSDGSQKSPPFCPVMCNGLPVRKEKEKYCQENYESNENI